MWKEVSLLEKGSKLTCFYKNNLFDLHFSGSGSQLNAKLISWHFPKKSLINLLSAHMCDIISGFFVSLTKRMTKLFLASKLWRHNLASNLNDKASYITGFSVSDERFGKQQKFRVPVIEIEVLLTWIRIGRKLSAWERIIFNGNAVSFFW